MEGTCLIWYNEQIVLRECRPAREKAARTWTKLARASADTMPSFNFARLRKARASTSRWLAVCKSMAARIWTGSCCFFVLSCFHFWKPGCCCEEGNRAPPIWRSCHDFSRRPSRSLARSRYAPTRPGAQSAQALSKGTQKERRSCEPRRISQTATGEK